MNNLDHDLCELHAEACGALSIQIYRPTRAAELLGRVIGGDDRSAALLRLIRQASDTPPPECFACGAHITRGKIAGVAVILPLVPDRRNAMSGAICAACARADDATVVGNIAHWLQASAWPDLRVIPAANLHCRGGRA